MDDARRFFRYVIPGLTFIIELSLFFLLSNPEKFLHEIIKMFSNRDLGFGAPFVLFIASGALGFLLGIIYHFLYWLPIIRRHMVDHSPMIKKMIDIGWLRIKFCDSCNVDKKEITQSGAWRILTAFWHSRKNSSKIIKGANDRIDSLGNTVHGLGTVFIGAVMSFPVWWLFNYKTINICLDTRWIVILFCVYVLIICIHLANFHAIVRDFNSIIDIVMMEQIRNEYEKNGNIPVTLYIDRMDLTDKYTSYNAQ